MLSALLLLTGLITLFGPTSAQAALVDCGCCGCGVVPATTVTLVQPVPASPHPVIHFKAGPVKKNKTPVQTGQEIKTPATLDTGKTGQVSLQFPDGQAVAVKSNSRIKINKYQFDPTNASKNKSDITLAKGGLRFIGGQMERVRPEAIHVRTPQANLGVRGTEFLAVIDPATGLYSKVSAGGITASNASGVFAFDAGAYAFVGTRRAIPMSVPESMLPPSVRAAFSELEGIPMAQPAMAPAPVAPAPAPQTPGYLDPDYEPKDYLERVHRSNTSAPGTTGGGDGHDSGHSSGDSGGGR
jgi:hypothetical protein